MEDLKSLNSTGQIESVVLSERDRVERIKHNLKLINEIMAVNVADLNENPSIGVYLPVPHHNSNY